MESQEVYLQALQPVSAASTTGSDIALGDPSVDALLTIIRVANLQDFMAAMKVDAEGSRQEPGCLRFDCLRDAENHNKFCEAHTCFGDDVAICTLPSDSTKLALVDPDSWR